MGKKLVFLREDISELSLEGVNNAISAEAEEGRAIDIDVGPTVFQVGVLRQERAVALHWTGMTNFRNIVWQRFVLLRLRWPPVMTLSYFMNSEEEI